MEVSETPLGDICDSGGGAIKTGPFGSQLHQSDYRAEGTPVVMPKDILSGKVSPDDIALIGPNDVERLAHHKLIPGDIVYGRRGDIGRHALVTAREQGWLCGTGCLRIRLGDGPVNPGYLYYYLDQPIVVEWIRNQAIGATMPNLNTSILRSVPIVYPGRDAQEKVTSILSAYDDIIENNLRRVAILEEMAQLLYREWFIRLRFPGHGQIHMADSELGEIPEGWKVISLGSVVEIEKGKKPNVLTDTFHDGLVPYLLIDSMKGGRPKYTHADKMVLAEPDDVVMVMDGASSGVVTFGVSGAVGSTLARLRPRDNTDLTPFVLLLVLRQREDEIRSKNVGAAIPHANKEYLSRMKIALPPKEVTKAFDEICRPAFGLIWNLTHAIQTLRNTRDLLLPRLISGQLDVSGVDINIEALDT